MDAGRRRRDRDGPDAAGGPGHRRAGLAAGRGHRVRGRPTRRAPRSAACRTPPPTSAPRSGTALVGFRADRHPDRRFFAGIRDNPASRRRRSRRARRSWPAASRSSPTPSSRLRSRRRAAGGRGGRDRRREQEGADGRPAGRLSVLVLLALLGLFFTRLLPVEAVGADRPGGSARRRRPRPEPRWAAYGRNARISRSSARRRDRSTTASMTSMPPLGLASACSSSGSEVTRRCGVRVAAHRARPGRPRAACRRGGRSGRRTPARPARASRRSSRRRR